MAINGKFGGFEEPWVSPEQFKSTLQQVAKQLGEDEKRRIEEFNKLISAFNALNEMFVKLGEAHNATAEILDSLALHARWMMEKAGGFDAEGNATAEFQDWCAKQIADANAAREALTAAQSQKVSLTGSATSAWLR